MIVHATNPEQQTHLLTFIAMKVGVEPKAMVGDMPFHAMGAVRNSHLAGVAVFTNFRRHSIEVHVCGEPGWVTRADLAQLFGYPFQHLNVLRLWCLVARNNKKARRFAERLGFQVKCVADDEFGEGKDGIVFAMKRKDCKWLR